MRLLCGRSTRLRGYAGLGSWPLLKPGEGSSHIDRFVVRLEDVWPLARTEWTRFYLDPRTMRLSTKVPADDAPDMAYDAMGEALTFLADPLQEPTEVTGPSVLRLNISSETTDADAFAVLRAFDPQGKEVMFHDALDSNTPIGQGWLRASQRKQDPALSLPFRPYYTHDELQPLAPHHPVALDVEIWPTCIVVPPGYRIGMAVRGKDYELDGPAASLSNMKNPMRGCGPFVHDDEADRPPAIFGGRNTLHFGGGQRNCVTLPVIPPK